MQKACGGEARELGCEMERFNYNVEATGHSWSHWDPWYCDDAPIKVTGEH